MKELFLIAVFSFSAFSVSASEAEVKELNQRGKALMDSYYKDVIQELKHLKDNGNSFSAEDVSMLTAMISVKHFTNRTAESLKLVELLDKLEGTGEVKNFKVYNLVDPELVKQHQQAVMDLIKPGDAAPRFVGAVVVGTSQLSTDVVRMGLTRY